LGEVEIDFISFVPRGANRKKYFLVKEDGQLKEDILKSILETDEGEVSRVLKEAGLEGEAAGVLEAAAKLLKAYRDELPDGALQILAKACGLPEKEPAAKSDPKKEGAGTEGSAEGLSKEAIAKMDPEVRAIFEKMAADSHTATERAERAENIAKSLQDEKVLKEYVEKAGDLSHLPVEPLKFGPVLKALGEGHPAEFEEILRVLKAADAALAKSELFKEMGKTGSGETSAEAAVYAKARAIVAKDADLTFDEAVAKVLEDDPELYERYEDERQAAARKRGGK
jgi:hypothetical protein